MPFQSGQSTVCTQAGGFRSCFCLRVGHVCGVSGAECLRDCSQGREALRSPARADRKWTLGLKWTTWCKVAPAMSTRGNIPRLRERHARSMPFQSGQSTGCVLGSRFRVRVPSVWGFTFRECFWSRLWSGALYLVFRVWCLVFGVWGLVFGVWGLGFRCQNSGFGVGG